MCPNHGLLDYGQSIAGLSIEKSTAILKWDWFTDISLSRNIHVTQVRNSKRIRTVLAIMLIAVEVL
jgi:hypothetical protein